MTGEVLGHSRQERGKGCALLAPPIVPVVVGESGVNGSELLVSLLDTLSARSR
jgi:hypothetical protein